MSNQPSPSPASGKPSDPDKTKQPKHESASQKADKPAKKGEPLKADKPGERSPKQENL